MFHGSRLLVVILSIASFKGNLCNGDGSCETLNSGSAEVLLQSKSHRQLPAQHGLSETSPASAAASKNTSSMSSISASVTSISTLAYPKVLRSMYDKSTLFYHVHMPKTGGSTVAHLLASDICAPFEDLINLSGWRAICGVTCELGFTDNEFACADPSRNQAEHNAFVFNQQRAESLKTKAGAKKVIYVTTLRRGSDRVVSQWKAELGYGSFIPPVGIDPFSMRSLRHYIRARSFDGKHNLGKGWLSGPNPSLRNNYQVGMLASRMGKDLRVRPSDLEEAKKVLLTGDWIIGFTPCMQKLQDRLLEHTIKVHGGYKHKDAPLDNDAKQFISLDQETQDMLDEHAYLDNALFDWAWSLAQSGTDPRFTRIC